MLKIKKMTKFSPNDKKKKKTILCYNTPNTFQMYSNECIKSLILIQFNPKRRKHEKNPFTLSLSRFCS
ncbi:hypothetical protein RGC62_01985, partial [Helicobacter pylori]|nr:hypothetical protein [Helicobacter pylori]